MWTFILKKVGAHSSGHSRDQFKESLKNVERGRNSIIANIVPTCVMTVLLHE